MLHPATLNRIPARDLALAFGLAAAIGCTARKPTAPAGEQTGPPSGPTWASDVAAILDRKCVTCHREGQVGPFGLAQWEDVRDHAQQILEVIDGGFMPPWKPTKGIGTFANDRSLTDEERATIRAWVTTGARRGDPSARPPLPPAPAGWMLGTPDLVVSLPAGYVLAAEGTDEYHNFVVEAPSDAVQWVRAWELRPTNAAVVHHAILNIDRTGWARREAAKTAAPGFGGMEVGEIQSPDGHYLVWAPGNTPSKNTDTAWRLDASTDLVLQLHLQPTGKPEPVGATIGLYFARTPPARRSYTLRSGDPPIDIPAGEADYRIEDRWTVPVDGMLISAFPHAHYLATRFDITATPPGGAPTPLLRIEDWDFYWQDQYRFDPPVAITAGTELHLEVRYDNSAKNVRNPSNPPVRVTGGVSSTDEMGNVTFEFQPSRPRDDLTLREAKYRRDLTRGYGRVKAHYNLGNVLRARVQYAAAIEQYEAALALSPEHIHALSNLAITLGQAGKKEESERMTHEVLKRRPGDPAALTNLGTIARVSGRTEEAMARYREALTTDPAYGPAVHNLAALLVDADRKPAARALLLRAAEAGDGAAALRVMTDRMEADPAAALDLLERAIQRTPEDGKLRLSAGMAALKAKAPGRAVSHLQRAAVLRPDDALVEYQLGEAYLAADRPARAVRAFERSVALNPDFAPVHNNLGVLSAMRGDTAAARTHFERAVALDPDDARARANLEKLRKPQPGTGTGTGTGAGR